jgi:hypothetical protein
MKEVVGVCGANLNRNDMGSHCLLGTNGFKHIWSGRAEGETHYDPESIYPFVSYCSKANMGHPNRGSFGNLYIHRVGLTVFDAVHEQSLKSSAGSNIWDTFTSSSSAEHISGDITYCHCSVHDLTASSERLFTLSGDNKKMITGSELGISLYATYPYQCTIYGGNGTIYYDGSNSPVGETPYTLFGNACGGAGRQDT